VSSSSVTPTKEAIGTAASSSTTAAATATPGIKSSRRKT